MDMKSFLQFVVEVLSPDQRAQVDAWEGQTQQAKQMTDHFFGQNNEEMVVPFPTKTEKSQTHKDIEAAIGQEIPIEDYIAGVIRRPTGNPIRIPRRLTEPSLVKAFSEDPSRSGKKNEADALQGYTVRITRSKYGVANQTANQQPWSSCKRFGGCGPGEAYLRTEAQHGTVVSYLIDPDGNEVGRTTLQPLRNSQGDHIYSVWGEYGNDHGAWKAFNQNLSRQLSAPFRRGRDPVFLMDTDRLYQDGKNSTIIDPEADSASITHVINNPPNIDSIRSLRGHRNFGQEHVDQIFDLVHKNHQNYGAQTIGLMDFTRQLLKPQKNDANSRSWKITPEHLSKVFSMKSAGDDEEFTDTTAQNVDLANTTYALNYLQSSALSHPNITTQHYEQALQNASGYVKSQAFKNVQYTPEDLHRLIDSNTSIPYSGILQHPSLDSSHIDKIIDRSRWHEGAWTGPQERRSPLFYHNFGQELARVHSKIRPETLQGLLMKPTAYRDETDKSPIFGFKQALVRQRQFSQQEFRTLMNNTESVSIRDEAIRNAANPQNTSVQDVRDIIHTYAENRRKLEGPAGTIPLDLRQKITVDRQMGLDDIGRYMSNTSLLPHFKEIISDPNLTHEELSGMIHHFDNDNNTVVNLAPIVAQRPNLNPNSAAVVAVHVSRALDRTDYDDRTMQLFDTLHTMAKRQDIPEAHKYVLNAVSGHLHGQANRTTDTPLFQSHALEVARTMIANKDLHPDAIDNFVRYLSPVRNHNMFDVDHDHEATAGKISLWRDLLTNHGSRMSLDQLKIGQNKMEQSLQNLGKEREHILRNEELGEGHPKFISNANTLTPAITDLRLRIGQMTTGSPYTSETQ